MTSASPECLVFLVRIWREPFDARSNTAERAYVLQFAEIPGGEERYFGSLEEMVGYIQSHWLGRPPQARE
ncbi:MAG: hypothetical protein HY782_22230 [Chloroflexi bacterium]|nr:hypothetical protein [Chloroflexota bacterium]